MLRKIPPIAMLFSLGMLVLCGCAFAESMISGVVSYSGSRTGDIYVAAFDDKYCLIPCYGVKITSPGSYTMEVEEGRWFVKAFMDAAGNGPPHDRKLDPQGKYPDYIIVDGSRIADVDIQLFDPRQK